MSTNDDPRHLIILGHPRAGSFNHQVADRYAQAVRSYWQDAEIRDLYASGFDPLLRPGAHDPALDQEIELLHGCDVLVFVYPIWFGTPPAIIKGYVDRVLGGGFNPSQLASGEPGSLAGKRFLTLSSSATSLPWLNERGQWHSLRQAFDRYLSALFGFRAAEHTWVDVRSWGTEMAPRTAALRAQSRRLLKSLAIAHIPFDFADEASIGAAVNRRR